MNDLKAESGAIDNRSWQLIVSHSTSVTRTTCRIVQDFFHLQQSFYQSASFCCGRNSLHQPATPPVLSLKLVGTTVGNVDLRLYDADW